MEQAKCSILIVDDEPLILAALSNCLRDEFEVHTAAAAGDAIRLMEGRHFDLLLCDQKMPGTSGVELLEWARLNRPTTLRMLMSGFAELEDAIDAINRARVYRYLFKPWPSTEELIQILREAAKEFLAERRSEQLAIQLRKLNDELENQVRQRTAELERANRRLDEQILLLKRLALTDELTQLSNRRAIEQILQSELCRRSRHPSPLAVALVDADHFREINRQYLHTGGDEVLRVVADVLGNSVRRKVDFVGRWGGEEFLVIAPMTAHDGAYALGERIRQAVASCDIRYMHHQIHVTVSVGFTVIAENLLPSPEKVIHSAAAALSEAKAQGRNRCIVIPFSHELPQANVETLLQTA